MTKEKAAQFVVGYIRCSSDAQVRDGETMERQRELIVNYATAKELGRVEIIADEGISGFKSNRPGFQRLFEMCRSGTVKTVIVYDLSRLSRSVRDTLAFVDDVVHKRGVALVSLQQDLDTSTPHGRAFLSFIAVFNQLYRDEIAFKTKVALHHKKSKGERYSGSLPYGFDDLDGRLVPSDCDRQLIVRIRAMRNEGLSLRQIAKRLATEGFKTKKGRTCWSPQVINDLLRRAY